ncbi:MAG: 23S rRNA (guanosine(2251)-2'-O)-methyltransferase RlmB [Gammaproteobacteria bacterium]|nr:MAG: 23S rRNA (guanosine(2251)-2'-O)-methyltransferase RlmB [Gammaproteobacteria bacterium]PIE35131.1 MAG: 23S rRNA (guanosine(2251)-2'-O)-methyltransferase RlmB [Gammaproteobacteria bacterium]
MSQSDSSWMGGLHSVAALLEHRAGDIAELLVVPGRRDRRVQSIIDAARAREVPISETTRAVLDRELPDIRHQGVAARLRKGAAQPVVDLGSLLAGCAGRTEPPLLLVLDGVTDPHNLGACLRSADAAGADAVVVPADNSAPLSAVARKVASGAAEAVPVIRVRNLRRALEEMRAAGLWIYGAAGEGETTLHELSLSGPVALVMGAEGSGLRRLTREGCDLLYRIPMAGTVSSLNVSVAAGVSLFEALRQRR